MRRLLLRLAALCLVVAAAPQALVAQPAAPAGQEPAQAGFRLYLPALGQSGLVVFSSDRDSGSTIVALQPASGAASLLTGPSTNDSAPAISPDGRLVAFYSTRDGANGAYLMERSGANQRKIASCNICMGLSWSPDGRSLLVTEQYSSAGPIPGPPTNITQVSRINLDGTPPQRTYGEYAAWSPDGQLIAFVAQVEGGRTLRIAAAQGAEEAAVQIRTPSIGSIAWSPDSAQIAFTSYQEDGSYDLYVTARAGGPARRLAAGTAPAWSPDSAQIAFLETVAGSNSRRLALIAPDGSGLLRLAEQANSLPAWSPDGALVAFSQGDSDRRAAIVPRAGGPAREISGPRNPWGFAWSPDGAQLAFTSGDTIQQSTLYLAGRESGLRSLGGGGPPSWTPDGAQIIAPRWASSPPMLYVMPLGTESATALTPGDLPAISPADRRIAYLHEGQLYLIGDDGAGRRRLTSGLALQSRPVWSPDGARLAFVVGPATAQELYLIGADGAGLRRVAACAGPCTAPAWSPDGARLAFVVGPATAQELYLIGADGAGLRRVAACAGPCTAPAWSPDGTEIAYSADGIFLALAAGGAPRRLRAGGSPAWSPDGRQIAFVDFSGVGVMQRDGSGARTLIEHESLEIPYGAPRWSPDGRLISMALSGTIGGKVSVADVAVIRADTGGLVGRWDGWQPSWFAGGARLAYLHEVRFAFYELFYYSLASSYTKLCLDVVPSDGCGGLPRGHGNALAYDISP